MIYKYIRYSSNSQDERQQERTIDVWLLQRGMKADAVIKDEGISGDADKRKRKLFQLARDLKMNDTLVVSEISRLTRSGFGELDDLIQHHFKPNHLRLVICNVGLDINCSQIDAMTELQLSMLSIFAKMEKELIVGRTKSALDARKDLLKRDGGWMSKPSKTYPSGKWTTGFGRKKGSSGPPISDASNAAWKEKIGGDENRHRQWKLIHELTSKGDTLDQIASTLNAIGEKTPRGGLWSKAQVSRVLNDWDKYFLVKSETRLENSKE